MWLCLGVYTKQIPTYFMTHFLFPFIVFCTFSERGKCFVFYAVFAIYFYNRIWSLLTEQLSVLSSSIRSPTKVSFLFKSTSHAYINSCIYNCTCSYPLFCIILQGSPTNNVSPTSTPSKSAASVPTLEPPPTEAASASAAAAPAPSEPATE